MFLGIMSKKYYDVADVKKAAAGGWVSVLSQLGADAGLLTDRHSACPACGGKDRFRFDDKNGEGTFICGGGGDFQSGDGIALVMHLLGCEWKDAVNRVGELLGCDGKEFRGGGAGGSSGKPNRNAGVAAEPQPERSKKKLNELYDHELLKKQVAGVEDVDVRWLMERSPVDPRGVTPGEFLEAIFEPDEKALVFSNFFSQGDFAWWVGKGGFRLGKTPDVRAVRSDLPVDGGKDGVWFLSNPVDLKWSPKPNKPQEVGRRTKESVTKFRYLVLESDIAKELRKEGQIEKAIEAEVNWLKYLACFSDPIRAIYSSGGGSVHALVEVNAASWAQMDGILKGNPNAKSAGMRMGAKSYWAMYGADAAALTPVRLTRLPGCTRGGKEQRLYYLNPNPRCAVKHGEQWVLQRLVDMVPMREVK